MTPSTGTGTGVPLSPTITTPLSGPCTGRYAEAWQYSAFWCQAQLLNGYDNSGGAGNAYVTDTFQDFEKMGARANVGQILYNLSQGTSGYITAVTETTLTASGVSWNDGDNYRVIFLNSAQRAMVEHALNVTTGDIFAALGSVDACDCTYSVWGLNFLAEINIILARLFFNTCPCSPTISEGDKNRWAKVVNDRLELIRTGKVDVCFGATGAAFPAIGIAEQAVTEFAAARIIANDSQRNS